jgi:two-component system OmpR family response regulator
MKILNYSFFENEKFDMKKVDDNEAFFNEVISKKYDVILADFSFYSDVKEIKKFFNGYIIFLNYFCDSLYYKKVLEIGDFCYLYSEYEKIVLRLDYINRKILKNSVIKFNEFTYNFKTKSLYYKNELIYLTKAENEVLYFLLKNKKVFISKIEILENIDFIEKIDSIKVIISNLRKKGINIINKKNLGYKINLRENK